MCYTIIACLAIMIALDPVLMDWTGSSTDTRQRNPPVSGSPRVLLTVLISCEQSNILLSIMLNAVLCGHIDLGSALADHFQPGCLQGSCVFPSLVKLSSYHSLASEDKCLYSRGALSSDDCTASARGKHSKCSGYGSPLTKSLSSADTATMQVITTVT